MEPLEVALLIPAEVQDKASFVYFGTLKVGGCCPWQIYSEIIEERRETLA